MSRQGKIKYDGQATLRAYLGSLNKQTIIMGIPWLSSGLSSLLPLQVAWVLILVGKLRYGKSHSMAKRKKKTTPKHHNPQMLP